LGGDGESLVHSLVLSVSLELLQYQLQLRKSIEYALLAETRGSKNTKRLKKELTQIKSGAELRRGYWIAFHSI
jgi:hypothetical protein